MDIKFSPYMGIRSTDGHWAQTEFSGRDLLASTWKRLVLGPGCSPWWYIVVFSYAETIALLEGVPEAAGPIPWRDMTNL